MLKLPILLFAVFYSKVSTQGVTTEPPYRQDLVDEAKALFVEGMELHQELLNHHKVSQASAIQALIDKMMASETSYAVHDPPGYGYWETKLTTDMSNLETAIHLYKPTTPAYLF
ncbi:unnamed protein product [Oppiella nova]|uniref:Uncharacterized protein n=1 Tax=Oppiella nova TaxID=334625 RepID=A0A7R9M7J6_9ACAR|nr:unnamed protein product [Oppiella nova]CAG2172087.1 unnamed protein product [Oppiella nova]